MKAVLCSNSIAKFIYSIFPLLTNRTTGMAEQRVKVGSLVPMRENLEDDLSRHSFSVFRGSNFIGRDDLPRADKQVSRKHIRLDGLNSGTTKLYVEGQNPVNIQSGASKKRLLPKEDVILQDGDIIELIPGKYPFQYQSAGWEDSKPLCIPYNNKIRSCTSEMEKGEQPESSKKKPACDQSNTLVHSDDPSSVDKLLLKRKRQIHDDELLAQELQAMENERAYGGFGGSNDYKIPRSYFLSKTETSDPPQNFGIPRKCASFSLLRVQGLPTSANADSVSLSDVIKGDIIVAILSNYMVDIDWLLSECPILRTISRVVIIHGESGTALERLNRAKLSSWFLHKPPLRLSYGTHHSKAMLLVYAGGVRVVVHTANLIYIDWNNKTQGLWMQDFPLKDKKDTGKTSAFEDDLVEYLEALEWSGCSTRIPEVGDVKVNADFFRRFDYSNALVRLIASVPGYHNGPKLKKWGHMKLRTILQEQLFKNEFKNSPLVYQFSSLGSLDEKWMSELALSMCSGVAEDNEPLGTGPVQIIWPTVEDVRNSIEGYAAGNAIPSPLKNVEKAFLKKYWARWQADHTGRSRAMPHIKSYVRYNDQDIAWFLLTSANLSKAAWGSLQKNASQLMIRSYELGVIFMPSHVLKQGRHISFTEDCSLRKEGKESNHVKNAKLVTLCWQGQENSEASQIIKLPIPYSIPPKPYNQEGIPPKPYNQEDVPWSWDRQYQKPDVYGEVWPRSVNLYTFQ